MEEFSRRALIALAVAAAGPGAAMLTLLLIGPTLVAESMPGTDGGIVETVGSGLVGVFIGAMLSGLVAYALGVVATLVAFVASKCPRPYLAWLVCLVLSPVWLGALSTLDLDLTGFAVLSGALPGAVRLGFGYLEPPPGRTGDPVAPSSGIG